MDGAAAVDGALRALGEMSGCALGLDDDGVGSIELAGGAETFAGRLTAKHEPAR